MRWFRRAAELGSPAAQSNLGVMYENGRGVEKDPVQAAQWYRKAAEQGNPGAQHHLAMMFLQGEGVEKNPAEGAPWCHLAARKGLAAAQVTLAKMYHEGLGVDANPAEADWYLRKAAEQNHVGAQYALAVAYAKGEGVDKIVYCTQNVTAPESVYETGMNAVEALGLDFGAVDILCTHNGEARVLEVNTAPGLEGSTLNWYAAQFNTMFGRAA